MLKRSLLVFNTIILCLLIYNLKSINNLNMELRAVRLALMESQDKTLKVEEDLERLESAVFKFRRQLANSENAFSETSGLLLDFIGSKAPPGTTYLKANFYLF
jgi:septal ring factor EnvC (AmiA/AmiB activator)